MKRRILLVAGEASGDMHAARLAAALKRLEPGIELAGMGQAAMAKSGVELCARSDEIAVVGILEVFRYFGKIHAAFRSILSGIDAARPDLAVLVDYPGFNLRLLPELKKRGIPVIYYISPQVWAWWKGRIRTIKHGAEKILVLFPFEEKLYKRHGVPVEFVGHPMLDSVNITSSRSDLEKRHPGFADKRLVALLPGSREREIDFILPAMLASARKILQMHPDVHFVISRAPHLPDAIYEKHMKAFEAPHTAVRNEEGSFCSYLAASDLALVASGTATLECAVTGTPLLIIYRMAFLSALIFRMVVRMPYVGLVNIVAGKKIAPEFLQFEARPDLIAREASSLLSSDGKLENMRRDLNVVRERLGSKGASDRAARAILDAFPSKCR